MPVIGRVRWGRCLSRAADTMARCRVRATPCSGCSRGQSHGSEPAMEPASGSRFTVISCYPTRTRNTEFPASNRRRSVTGARSRAWRRRRCARGAPIGAIGQTDTRASSLYRQTKLHFLKTFADQAVIAIENVRFVQRIAGSQSPTPIRSSGGSRPRRSDRDPRGHRILAYASSKSVPRHTS